MSDQTTVENKSGIKEIFDTRLLMISSALFMGVIGVLGAFIPEAITEYYNIGLGETGTILFKIAGTLYLSFAILNWMARGNIIGGIYSRPVALGNFFHFSLISLLLIKFSISNIFVTPIAICAGINAIFAGCFGYILFGGKNGGGPNACS